VTVTVYKLKIALHGITMPKKLNLQLINVFTSKHNSKIYIFGSPSPLPELMMPLHI
jgi:hypothetical protein